MAAVGRPRENAQKSLQAKRGARAGGKGNARDGRKWAGKEEREKGEGKKQNGERRGEVVPTERRVAAGSTRQRRGRSE